MVQYFTFICIPSLRIEIFRSEIKKRTVIAIFKAGDKHKSSKYSPISLLPQFSKIFEKKYVRMDNLITKHNTLSEQIYDFRKNYISSFTLVEFVERLASTSEKEQYAIGIFLDIKKLSTVVEK